MIIQQKNIQKKFYKGIICVVVFLLFQSLTKADDTEKRFHIGLLEEQVVSLRQKLSEKVKKGEIVGGLIGVIDVNRPQSEIAIFCAGKTSLDQDASPVNPKTLFEIGSITKTFVGLALSVLVNSNVVKLDDPISKYLPEFQGTAVGTITLSELASHSSGLPRERDSQMQELEKLQEKMLPLRGP